MSESPLMVKSKTFALEVIRACQALREAKCESALIHQFLRSGTKDIEWLKIDLTPENRKTVLDILKRIHVPGEVFEDCVFVYGYRTDVDYIE